MRHFLDLHTTSAEDLRGMLAAAGRMKAARAGLPKGAVITKVDDHVIDGPDALVATIRSKAPGDNVALTFDDPSGASHTIQVTLGQTQS